MDSKVYWSVLAWANITVLMLIAESFLGQISDYDKYYGVIFCLMVLTGHTIYFIFRGVDVLHDLSTGRRK